MVNQYQDKRSRRIFLKQAISASLLVGSGIFSPALFASTPKPFDFREGQAELLLHFNENSLGMAPSAISAAQQAIALHGNRYQDAHVEVLRHQLAKRLGVEYEQVILGNGSTEVIGAVVTLCAANNATVIEPTPTFGDVRSRAKAYGLPIVQVETGQDFVSDIRALKAAAEKTSGFLLINICNPNNPTGNIVDYSALHDWIEGAPSHHFFLIDEAYFEYAQKNPAYESAMKLIHAGKENVIVTRTFSKIYGMAGMRIGYAIAAPKTAIRVDEFASTFNLSAAGLAAASASLKDHTFYKQSLESNEQGKKILTDALKDLELDYIQSDTNFVLHRINSDLSSYSERMKSNGIWVGRRMTKSDGWNRISIGTPLEMKDFAKTLKRFRERGWV